MEEKKGGGEEEKKEKTDDYSGHYVIASSRPPKRRPLEHCTLVPIFGWLMYRILRTHDPRGGVRREYMMGRQKGR